MSLCATSSEGAAASSDAAAFRVIALYPHVYGVLLGSDAILLDVQTDRYHALVEAVDRDGSADSAGIDQILLPEAAEALIEADLAFRGSGRAFNDLKSPEKEFRALANDDERPAVRDGIDLIAALVTTGWRMRRGLPCRSYHPSRAPAGTTRLVDVHLAMAALCRIRLYVPTPRRCLPASLVTAMFLARRGFATQIVFGVRSYPFEAHCWVEHAGIVMDDTLDKVLAYRPIVVGQP